MYATVSRKPAHSKADPQSEEKKRLAGSQLGNENKPPENDVIMRNPLRADLGNPETLQRKCDECEQEEQEPQTGMVQTKLTVGAPDDKYEQEADQVAQRVMRMPDPLGKLNNDLEDGEETVVRKQENGEENTELIQAKKDILSAPASPEFTAMVSEIHGGGKPLPPSVRDYFEPQFQQSFKNVRLHTDSRAASAAQSIHARAFTLGNDIAFAPGEYSTDSIKGKRLLAHELTHVVQQSSSGTPLLTIQRNGSDATDDVELTPQHENQSIAVWEGFFDTTIQTHRMMGSVALPYHLPISSIPHSMNPEGWTRGHYGSRSGSYGSDTVGWNFRCSVYREWQVCRLSSTGTDDISLRF